MTDAPSPDAPSPVTTSVEGSVSVIRIDDGKANALSHALLGAVNAALEAAQHDDTTGAVAIIGRPGRFSAGFDLKVMQSSPEAARDLLRAGAELGLRLYQYPKPVVTGVSGHALAMGAILQFCVDERIGAAGDFKIGMNEVAIGMPVPRFAVELARDRLTPPAFQAATQQARIYDPEGAVAAGYLDAVVPAEEVEAAAIAHATELAAKLNRGAFQLTRTIVRSALAAKLVSDLDEDMALFSIA